MEPFTRTEDLAAGILARQEVANKLNKARKVGGINAAQKIIEKETDKNRDEEYEIKHL